MVQVLFTIAGTPMKRLRTMYLITLIFLIWVIMGFSARSRMDSRLVNTLVSRYQISLEGAEEAVYNILHKKGKEDEFKDKGSLQESYNQILLKLDKAGKEIELKRVGIDGDAAKYVFNEIKSFERHYQQHQSNRWKWLLLSFTISLIYTPIAFSIHLAHTLSQAYNTVSNKRNVTSQGRIVSKRESFTAGFFSALLAEFVADIIRQILRTRKRRNN